MEFQIQNQVQLRCLGLGAVLCGFLVIFTTPVSRGYPFAPFIGLITTILVSTLLFTNDYVDVL
jgi:hypothetical protein